MQPTTRKRPDNTAEQAFPRWLSKPALRALAAAGYTRLDQLATARGSDLAKLHGMGPKAINLIRDALAARGQSLADSGE